MNRLAAGLFLLFAMASAAAATPIAGEYSCYILALGGSIMTPYGSAPTVTPMPSGINRVWLEEGGRYRHASGAGRYRYDSANGRVIFESGPLEGFTTRSEADGERRWLRFAAQKGGDLAPKSRLGEHICVLKQTDSHSASTTP
jgi:hypothetical protein